MSSKVNHSLYGCSGGSGLVVEKTIPRPPPPPPHEMNMASMLKIS